MKQVVILSGSARPGNVSDRVVSLVAEEVSSRDDLEAVLVDVAALNLPFFDSPEIPSSENFAPQDENVQKWSSIVSTADAVVLVTPEYNASMSAIQKNALDWLFAEWKDKPVAMVGYGWHSGERVQVHAQAILDNLKVQSLAPTANFGFMKELSVDGTVLNQESVSRQLQATVDAIALAISN